MCPSRAQESQRAVVKGSLGDPDTEDADPGSCDFLSSSHWRTSVEIFSSLQRALSFNMVEINEMEVTWGTSTEQGGVAEGTVAGLKPDLGCGAEGKWQILPSFYHESMPKRACCFTLSSLLESPLSRGGRGGIERKIKTVRLAMLRLFPHYLFPNTHYKYQNTAW